MHYQEVIKSTIQKMPGTLPSLRHEYSHMLFKLVKKIISCHYKSKEKISSVRNSVVRNWVQVKEIKKLEKYLEHAREDKIFEDKLIPIFIGALGTVSCSLSERMKELETRRRISTILMTAKISWNTKESASAFIRFVLIWNHLLLLVSKLN